MRIERPLHAPLAAHRRAKPITRNSGYMRAAPLGSSIMAILIALIIGWLMAHEIKLGIGLIGGVIAAALIIACMLDTATGLIVNLIFSFTAFQMTRLGLGDDFPVGTVDDVLVFATLLGLFLRKVPMTETFHSFVQKTVVIWFLIYLGYGMLELFNPYAHSIQGWILGFRKLLATYVLLFTAYEAFKDRKVMNRFIMAVFWACVGIGLYGCIQQWFGLFPFEREWVLADDLRFGLIFIAGDFRKFSMLSDPMAFGLLMAACALFFTILAMGESGKKKRMLLIGVIPMYLGMAYSGTRTANFMVVIGLGLYVLLTINQRATKFFAVLSALVILTLIYIPYYNNATLNRFKSTFQTSQDESYKVREMNRAYIQPYIWSHPIGGGLCTTGIHGLQFNPGHYLAGFPPDNGYLEKALETGSIGLALICLLYFFILRTGIGAYFHANSREDKMLAAGCTVAIFSFYAATYSQVALGQLSDIIIYYPFIAILLRIGQARKT